MSESIFSLVPREPTTDILENLQALLCVPVRLMDLSGNAVLSFGEESDHCSLLKEILPVSRTGRHLPAKPSPEEFSKGTSYVLTRCSNVKFIVFPLTNQGEPAGYIIIGPFLDRMPDIARISTLSEQHSLSVAQSLELYRELEEIPVYDAEKIGRLKKLTDHLLCHIMTAEQEQLLQSMQQISQQAQKNAAIQSYTGQQADHTLVYFHKKETELLAKVRTGTTTEVKSLLNELIGYVLFSEGGQMEAVRIRSIELTTLLSRVAIDGGAQAGSVYQLNSQFILKLYQEQSLDGLCLMMQEVLECFMNAMFSGTDKGNPYIRKALRYMMDNYSEHMELSQVAEFVQLSPSYFSTLFHKIVGVSFREELCRIRVEESKHLLMMPQYSLGDIAVSMGFPDQSYYCKVFKRIIGISPGKFRS